MKNIYIKDVGTGDKIGELSSIICPNVNDSILFKFVSYYVHNIVINYDININENASLIHEPLIIVEVSKEED